MSGQVTSERSRVTHTIRRACRIWGAFEIVYLSWHRIWAYLNCMGDPGHHHPPSWQRTLTLWLQLSATCTYLSITKQHRETCWAMSSGAQESGILFYSINGGCCHEQ